MFGNFYLKRNEKCLTNNDFYLKIKIVKTPKSHKDYNFLIKRNLKNQSRHLGTQR